MFFNTSCTPIEEPVIMRCIPETTDYDRIPLFNKPSDDYEHNRTKYLIDKQLIANTTETIKIKQSKHKISTLKIKRLSIPIDIIVEYDDEYYLARTLDLPLYACGDDIFEAIQNLKDEIESVYYELKEDDKLSNEWQNYKQFLNTIIID
ncbi:MAG: hypothetical protein C4582_09010 [Desulfobacteraceae bacterium]|nr:MAG: hypothetical protein C4582_09010 [Desulfobacteraceae bacterium]